MRGKHIMNDNYCYVACELAIPDTVKLPKSVKSALVKVRRDDTHNHTIYKLRSFIEDSEFKFIIAKHFQQTPTTIDLSNKSLYVSTATNRIKQQIPVGSYVFRDRDSMKISYRDLYLIYEHIETVRQIDDNNTKSNGNNVYRNLINVYYTIDGFISTRGTGLVGNVGDSIKTKAIPANKIAIKNNKNEGGKVLISLSAKQSEGTTYNDVISAKIAATKEDIRKLMNATDNTTPQPAWIPNTESGKTTVIAYLPKGNNDVDKEDILRYTHCLNVHRKNGDKFYTCEEPAIAELTGGGSASLCIFDVAFWMFSMFAFVISILITEKLQQKEIISKHYVSFVATFLTSYISILGIITLAQGVEPYRFAVHIATLSLLLVFMGIVWKHKLNTLILVSWVASLWFSLFT